jgi:hypothetical protein
MTVRLRRTDIFFSPGFSFLKRKGRTEGIKDTNFQNLFTEVIELDIWIGGQGFNGERSRFAVFCQDGNCKVVDVACNQTADDMLQHSLHYALNHVAREGDTIFTDSKQAASAGIRMLNGRKVKIARVPKEENKAGRLLI